MSSSITRATPISRHFEQLSAERFKACGRHQLSMESSTCVVWRSRSCESRRAAVSFRYHQLEAASPGPAIRRITPPNGLVGGFTESLAQELAPFGVKVCALEPGGMRTNWGARANQDTPDLLPDYEPSVGSVVKALESYWGHETGDPVKVAQVILRLAAADRLPAHLLLGSDAAKNAGDAEATRAADAELLARHQRVDPTSTHAAHCLMWRF